MYFVISATTLIKFFFVQTKENKMTKFRSYDLRAVDTIDDNKIVLLDKDNKVFFLNASEFHNCNAPASDYVGKHMLIKAKVKAKWGTVTKIHDIQECSFYKPKDAQEKKNPTI